MKMTKENEVDIKMCRTLNIRRHKAPTTGVTILSIYQNSSKSDQGRKNVHNVEQLMDFCGVLPQYFIWGNMLPSASKFGETFFYNIWTLPFEWQFMCNLNWNPLCLSPHHKECLWLPRWDQITCRSFAGQVWAKKWAGIISFRIICLLEGKYGWNLAFTGDGLRSEFKDVPCGQTQHTSDWISLFTSNKYFVGTP